MALKRKNIFNLSRYQFLTMTELELGKNKNALIAAMSKNYTGKTLIKLSNYILKNQVFSLKNNELWQFLTVTLNVEWDKLFIIWKDAKADT